MLFNQDVSYLLESTLMLLLWAVKVQVDMFALFAPAWQMWPADNVNQPKTNVCSTLNILFNFTFSMAVLAGTQLNVVRALSLSVTLQGRWNLFFLP